MMAAIKMANLALAFFVELGALVAFGYWGFHVNGNVLVKVGLGLGVPLVFAVFWGIFMAPNSTIHLTGMGYLLVKLIIFGLAVAMLAGAGQTRIAAIFGGVIVVNTILLQAWGQGQ